MSKIQIDGVTYDINAMSDQAKRILNEVQKVTERIQETQNMSAILNKAKKAYIADLKSEMLAVKAGLHFGED
jgi:hypothetical protein